MTDSEKDALSNVKAQFTVLQSMMNDVLDGDISEFEVNTNFNVEQVYEHGSVRPILVPGDKVVTLRYRIPQEKILERARREQEENAAFEKLIEELRVEEE